MGVTSESRSVGGKIRLQIKGSFVAVLLWVSPGEDGAVPSVRKEALSWNMFLSQMVKVPSWPWDFLLSCDPLLYFHYPLYRYFKVYSD